MADPVSQTTILCRKCGADGTHRCSMPGCPLPPLKDTEAQSNTTEEPDIPKGFKWYPFDPCAIQRQHEIRMAYAWSAFWIAACCEAVYLLWRFL